jgi:hypothetical protein
MITITLTKGHPLSRGHGRVVATALWSRGTLSVFVFFFFFFFSCFAHHHMFSSMPSKIEVDR